MRRALALTQRRQRQTVRPAAPQKGIIVSHPKPFSHRWRPIEDLPEDWRSLAASDVAALGSVWVEQAEILKGSRGLRVFNDRLRRRWSIETGIIERIYSIDRGTTNVLIEKGLEASLIPHGSSDRPAEYIADVLRDHEEALEGLFDFVAKGLPLSTSYIRQLHQVLCRNQPIATAKDQFGNRTEMRLIVGDWKKYPNNPEREDGSLHEYCPPDHVAAEMDRLIALHHEHEAKGVPPEIEAAWLHHRFSQIHPFQDGNGRVVRALASIVLLRARWFPLVIDRDMRAGYIAALETADAGDLKPLVDLVARNMRDSFKRALSDAAEVLDAGDSVGQVIASAVDAMKRRELAAQSERQKVYGLSHALESVAERRLQAARQDLESAVKGFGPKFHCKLYSTMPGQQEWFWAEVTRLSKRFEYFADLKTYHHWFHLRIVEKSVAGIVFSFHPLGRQFAGVMAVSAFVDVRAAREQTGAPTLSPEAIPACVEIFQFSYREPECEVARRFEKWLDECLVIALTEWRRQL